MLNISKELEGKVVYLRPTGNRKSRTRDDIYKATVDKVARVFVTITVFNQWSEKFRFESDSNRIIDDHNGGYIVYDSLQEVTDTLRIEILADKISGKFRYSHHFQALTLDVIEKVAKLLGIKV